MDLGPLRTLVRDLNFVAHGRSITVTRPIPQDTDPVSTSGIWLAPSSEMQPVGTDFHRRDPRRVMAVPRSATVFTIPKGSVIAAAEFDGGVAKSWRVDGYQREAEPDVFYLYLVPLSEVYA